MSISRFRYLPVWVALFLLMASLPRQIGSAAFRNLGMVLVISSQSAQPIHARTEEGKRWLQGALALHPTEKRALRGLAWISWKNRELETGRELFELYSQSAPGDVSVRLFLGDIAFEDGDLDNATRIWSSLPAGMLFVWRAKEFIAANDLGAAKQALDIAQKVGPSSYDLAYRLSEQFTALAAQYRKAGDREHETEACTNGSSAHKLALSFRPTYTFVRIRHGILLRDCGQFDEALAEFRKIGVTGQSAAVAWSQQEIGTTYQILGELPTAIGHYEKAVELQPDNGMYRILLGRARALTGDTSLALSDFEAVIETTQNNAWLGWAYSEQGSVYYTLGDMEKARQSQELAVKMQPERGDYRILLGVVLARIGEMDAARIQLQQAMTSNDPGWRAWAQREIDKLK